MPKQRSVHAGGYSVASAARLQSVQLPGKIKCAVCRKIKPVNFFSTIQQNALKNAIAIGDVHDATVEKWVPCVSCTPKQVTELECCICGEVKGLEGFAKAQRRLGEEARCITCVTELTGEAPVEESYRKHLTTILGPDSDSDWDEDSVSNAHESSTFGDTDYNAGVLLSSEYDSGYDLNQEDLKSLNLSSKDHTSKPSASQAATNASKTPTKSARVATSAGKWQVLAKQNGGESVESTKGAGFTGFDPDGNAHRMVRPPSTVASDEESDEEGDEGDNEEDNEIIPHPREQARMAREEREARSKFAKIPGGRAAPVIIPSYVGGKTVANPKSGYDDDEEDDDWGTI